MPHITGAKPLRMGHRTFTLFMFDGLFLYDGLLLLRFVTRWHHPRGLRNISPAKGQSCRRLDMMHSEKNRSFFLEAVTLCEDSTDHWVVN